MSHIALPLMMISKNLQFPHVLPKVSIHVLLPTTQKEDNTTKATPPIAQKRDINDGDDEGTCSCTSTPPAAQKEDITDDDEGTSTPPKQQKEHEDHKHMSNNIPHTNQEDILQTNTELNIIKKKPPLKHWKLKTQTVKSLFRGNCTPSPAEQKRFHRPNYRLQMCDRDVILGAEVIYI